MNAWPPTLEDEIHYKLASLLKAAAILRSEARAAEGAEARFRAAATAGAYRYADQLRAALEREEITAGRQLLDEVSLVANAAHCAGWLSASGLYGDQAALKRLVDRGFFRFYEKVPGVYVACYRLVDPSASAPSSDMS